MLSNNLLILWPPERLFGGHYVLPMLLFIHLYSPYVVPQKIKK